MLRRIDLLAALGTAAITISGGEPLLHPDLDELIGRIRSHGIRAGLITNGYLLTQERISRLNRAGLDHLQISIDNVLPDDISKKSLKVLDKKLCRLAKYAEFAVNVNSVIGSAVRAPEDAVVVARRALNLGLSSTVGLLHDGRGSLQALSEEQQRAYQELQRVKKPFYTSALYNRFHQNLARGLPNDWHCRAGSRYLYICEDGLVHYCSQQRGYPAIPLEQYTHENLEREYHTEKRCAPFCTISCAQRVAMIDEVREAPIEALARFFPSAADRPVTVRILTWCFLSTNKRRGRVFRYAALRLLGVK
jgi:MoaA/NifB/PqqE/SkfB family radical SAM enzyme